MFKYTIETVLILLFAISITSCFKASDEDITGKYVLISEDGCHHLPYKSDTMHLENQKIISSYNFPKGSVYTLKRKDFNNLLDIHSPETGTSMTFTVKKGWSGKLQIYICTDNQTRYEKIR